MSRGQVDSGQGFPCRLSGGRTTGEQQAASPPAPAASRARAPGALTQVTRSVCAEMPRAPGRQRQQEQAEGSGRGAPARQRGPSPPPALSARFVPAANVGAFGGPEADVARGVSAPAVRFSSGTCGPRRPD